MFDIFNVLLLKKTSIFLNKWIEEDTSRIRIIIEELQIKNEKAIKSDHFKENLKDLKLFEFADGSLLSDKELVEKQNQGYIVLHKNLKNIELELQKIGVYTSFIDLDYLNIYFTYNPYFSTESQLRNQAKVIEIVSNADLLKLSPEEKLKVFRTFRDGTEEGRRNERLGELVLFRNSLGQCVKIKNLLAPSEQSWLSPFQIILEESHTDINRYLISNKNFYYERIIFPFWPTIAKKYFVENLEKIEKIILEIQRYYELSEYSSDNEMLLSEHKIISYGGESCKANKIFFNSKLSLISKDKYSSVQEIVYNKFQIQIPDYEFLNLYSKVPFTLESNCNGIPTEDFTVSSYEAKNLLYFWNTCGIEILSEYSVRTNSDLSVSFFKSDIRNFYSSNNRIIEYIKDYHEQTLLLSPNIFEDFTELVNLKENNLSVHLIKSLNRDNRKQFIDLTASLLNEGQDILLRLLNLDQDILLDTSWDNEKENIIQLSLIRRLYQLDNSIVPDLHDKIDLKLGSSEFSMNSIDSANDRIIVQHQGKEISLSRSLILNFDDNNSLQVIQKFATEVVQKDLLTEREAQVIFKLKKENVTESLISQFLQNSVSKIYNTDQLLLVLTSSLEYKNYFKDLKVQDGEENWRPLRGNWIIPNENSKSYIPCYILSKNYKGLNSRLELKNGDCLVYGDIAKEEYQEDLILTSFQFRQGCTSKVFLEIENGFKFLKFLYNLWLITPPGVRITRVYEDWISLLGFDPGNKIIAKYVFNEELLDVEIRDWIQVGHDEKLAFLKALGVQAKGSDVAKLRQWLMSGENSTFNLGVEQIPESFLENTLLGLAEGFVDKHQRFKMQIDSKQHEVIVRIIAHLKENAKTNIDYRVPVYSSIGNLQMGDEQESLPTFLSEENQSILFGSDFKLLSILNSFTQIIYPHFKNGDLISAYYDELKIKYEFEEPKNFDEHNEPFYKSWRKEYNIRLFKVSSLEYYASAITDAEDYPLGKVSFNNFQLEVI